MTAYIKWNTVIKQNYQIEYTVQLQNHDLILDTPLSDEWNNKGYKLQCGSNDIMTVWHRKTNWRAKKSFVLLLLDKLT